MAQAWSRFRRTEKDAPLDAEEQGVNQDKDTPGTARGYAPAMWAAERLSTSVKPVTAQELLLRVRLRLRPRSTLSRWLAEVEQANGGAKSSRAAGEELAQAQALLAEAGSNAQAARRCFELAKELWNAD